MGKTMQFGECNQTIKTHDDKLPVFLRLLRGAASDQEVFQTICHTESSWAAEQEITTDVLRQRIEPWLTALVQSEHLSLLVGAGLSIATQDMAKVYSPEEGLSISFDDFQDENP